MTDIAPPSYQTSAGNALNFTASAARKVRDLIADCRDQGYRIRFVADAVVMHHLSVSSNRQSNTRKLRTITRNQFERMVDHLIERAKKPVMIVRGEGEQFSAFSLKCTHLGCTVGWNEAARSFDCPCHGSRFEIDGTVKKGPAKRPLTAYAVSSDGATLRFSFASGQTMEPRQEPCTPSTTRAPRWRQRLWKARTIPSCPRMTTARSPRMSKVSQSPSLGRSLTWPTTCQWVRKTLERSSARTASE
mgnify:CR=1 FL=1